MMMLPSRKDWLKLRPSGVLHENYFRNGSSCTGVWEVSRSGLLRDKRWFDEGLDTNLGISAMELYRVEHHRWKMTEPPEKCLGTREWATCEQWVVRVKF